MKKLLLIIYSLIACLSAVSCKKKEYGTEDPVVCFIVKDEVTNEPVAQASVYLVVDNDSAYLSSNYNFSTYYAASNDEGVACIEYNFFTPHLSELRITKQDYGEYCTGNFVHTNPTGNNDIILKKRSAFIKLHLVNQAPVFLTDSISLSAENFSYACYATDLLNMHTGIANDTSVIFPVISGENLIKWELRRNYTLINDSTITITVSLKDTVNVEIKY